jgi:phosphoserine phosphatase
VSCLTHDSTENKMIVFDMDSTLIDTETIDELAKAAGVVSKVEEITKRAICGDLDFGQALAEKLSLLEGLFLKTALDVSNELLVEDGCQTGKVIGPITQSDSKIGLFEELVRLNRVRPERCAVIGDGANDAGIFEKVGFAMAFNPNPILQEFADVVITKNLKSIIHVLESLTYQY